MMKISLTYAMAISTLGLNCELSHAIILDERDCQKEKSIRTFTVPHDGDPIPFGSNEDAHYMINPLIHRGALTIQNFSENWQGTVTTKKDSFQNRTFVRASHPLGNLTITVSNSFPKSNNPSSYCYGILSSKWGSTYSNHEPYEGLINLNGAITKNDCNELFEATSKNTEIPIPVLNKIQVITEKFCRE